VLRPFLSAVGLPEARRILTPPQRRFLARQTKLRTCCSPRRSGKSFAVMVWLTEEWRKRPGQISLFIATTTDQAIWIGWETFRRLNELMRWGFAPNQATSSWRASNGFVLRFGGAKDKNEANRFRGVPNIHRVAIDESGIFADALLKYLWQACLRPTLLDTDGEAALVGTPNPTGVGFYEDTMKLTEVRGDHFCWSIADNPHLARPGDEVLQEILAQDFGGDATNATFRIEYLGERVRDTGILIYTHGPEIWASGAPPPSRNYTAMGVDLGWFDGVGLVVARATDDGGVYVCEAHAESQMLPDRMAAMIERMRQEWRVAEIFVDTAGGGGRTICESLSGQYGIPAQPVKKGGARYHIEQIRGLLARQAIKLDRAKASTLADEWSGLPWDEDRMKHREGFADECTNALQYALTGSGFQRRTPWQVELSDDAQREREVSEARARARAAARRRGRR
jgi:hypothetical protein